MPYQYVLSVIIVFLGLIIGIILAKVSPEELRSGRTYFILLQKLILLILLIVGLLSNKIDTVVIIILSVLFVLFLFFVKLKKSIIYNLLALILYLFYLKESYIHIATLIFLYGIPTGTLFYHRVKQNKIKEFFLYYIWFLIIAILPFLILNL